MKRKPHRPSLKLWSDAELKDELLRRGAIRLCDEEMVELHAALADTEKARDDAIARATRAEAVPHHSRMVELKAQIQTLRWRLDAAQQGRAKALKLAEEERRRAQVSNSLFVGRVIKATGRRPRK